MSEFHRPEPREFDIKTTWDNLTVIRAVTFEVGNALRVYASSVEKEDFNLALLREKFAYAQRSLREVESEFEQLRRERLEKVKDYEELLKVALWEIESNGFDSMVSFPIFTGGKSSAPLENIAHGENLINYLSAYGYRVWSQVPYLDMNLNLEHAVMYDPKKKFDEFYRPLVQHVNFKEIVMMPGWEASQGCTTEHVHAKEAGKNILYIQEDWETDQDVTAIRGRIEKAN
jgi:hypothetical protein